jgi:hypothetical protein
MVSCAKKAPRSTYYDRIPTRAQLEQFYDLIEVTEEMWPELLPQFTAVAIVLEDAAPESVPLRKMWPAPRPGNSPMAGEGTKQPIPTPISPPPDMHGSYR